MENASKALIMAGSVLIALMIIGALLLMFNSLSSYQDTGTGETREVQVIEFNNQFETYLRDNIRGSDMISLMNRIIDYNTRKGDNTQEKYQSIEILITGIDLGNLKYSTSDSSIVASTYTQGNIGDLLQKVQDLEGKYQAKYITTLSSNISKVMSSENETQKLLPKNLTSYQGGYEQIKKDTASYYQYSQFKRLHFNCETSATKYNKQTGRITYIKFVCTNKLG